MIVLMIVVIIVAMMVAMNVVMIVVMIIHQLGRLTFPQQQWLTYSVAEFFVNIPVSICIYIPEQKQ